MNSDGWQFEPTTPKSPASPCDNCPHEAIAGPLACQQCPHYRPGFEYFDEAVPVYLLDPDPDDPDLERIHICPICGARFIDRPNTVYCCKHCRKAKELEKRREKRKRLKEEAERLVRKLPHSRR